MIIFTLKKIADIVIAVEKLEGHLKNLNVKTVIVYDKRLFTDLVVEALKDSSFSDRVSFLNFYYSFIFFQNVC